ncbi:MAG: hypothetical protein Q8Q48_01030 [Candidatus Staskawiczbacteria bacterium]|nr:hypothetical protein [Candidatus Staskawiczbacteria bacterium]
MKKILSTGFILLFLFVLLTPLTALGQEFNSSQGLVPCGKADDGSDACQISDFFIMLGLIYDFVIKFIAAPLAIIMLTIGAIILMISAGNPNLAGIGKKILWVSIIGLVLIFCSWIIVNFIMTTLGYRGSWDQL